MSTPLAICHGAFGRVTVYQLDKPIRPHAHRDGHLIFLLSGPPALMTVCGVPHLIDAASGLAINPWQEHDFQPSSSGAASVYLIAYIREDWLDGDREGRGGLRFGANAIRVGAALRSIAIELAQTLTANASYRAVDRYLNQLFDASFDESWAAGGQPGAAKASRTSIDYRVRKSLRLMDDGLAEGIELDDVARGAGLSRPNFYKLFRENIGITPGLYANAMRVDRALDRLTTSQAPVTDICFELGFSSQSHFTHFFAANVGIAPTLYRTIARVVRA